MTGASSHPSGRRSKRRPSGIFDEDETVAPPDEFAPPGKTIRDYLRETPAEPLSKTAKGLIWTAAIIVGGVLILTIYRAANPKAKPAGASIPATASGN